MFGWFGGEKKTSPKKEKKKKLPTVGRKKISESVYRADDSGLKKYQVDLIAKGLLEEIVRQVESGNRVELRGIGSFSKKSRKARKGRNPVNGETVHIPARDVVVFKPASALIERMNRRDV